MIAVGGALLATVLYTHASTDARLDAGVGSLADLRERVARIETRLAVQFPMPPAAPAKPTDPAATGKS